MEKNFDFSGWATKANLKCSDGRTILKDAFKDNDGRRVPLVWAHNHELPEAVLGHSILENRDEGVYAYGYFNDTENGQLVKTLVEHGDISAMSIFATQLKQRGHDVMHGNIREVSLVLGGANPGASIQSIIKHNDDGSEYENPEECVIYTGEQLSLVHADDQPDEARKTEEPKKDGDGDETVADVFNTLNEKQKTVVYAMLEEALKHADEDPEDDYDEEETEMKHNVFDQNNAGEDTQKGNTLSHDDMKAIIDDVKRYGNLKDAFLAHGIEQVDYLFPEAKLLNSPPDFIKRETGWVQKVMGGVHHTPFSRIKSMFADITGEEARARGYVKGNMKVEEVFGLLKRTTTPTTVYKKQKMDRDDVVDIVDFDVIAWLKSEMRMMLDEELARAYLIGDGRSAAIDGKINETNIRPIWTDDDLFTVKATVSVAANATDDQKAKATIRTIIKSRKNYKGSGNPTLFTTEDVLTDMLLLEDTTGRVIYDTEEKLRTALRVKEIVTIPVMENQSRNVNGTTRNLVGIIVNLNDYNVGADKGGAVNMFDDFDIDYNQQKYLIETRCSGALIKPYSAIAVELVETVTTPAA